LEENLLKIKMSHALIFSIHNAVPHRPMGPHRIATYLRQEGWDVEVVDFALKWTLDQLKELAKSRINSQTKFLGFSCWFGHWGDLVTEFCNWSKEKWPDIKLIYGSMAYPSSFDCKSIDYYVVGYGEKAVLDLVKSFTGNGNKIAFDPRWFGDKKLIVANETYPAFPMSSLMVKYEDRDYIESWEWLTTELARGCKFNCSFCTFPILGVKEDHSRSDSDFDYQMRDAYERFGVTNYYVADETINQDKEMLRRYADVSDKFNFNLRMHGFIRADLLVNQEDTWDLLLKLGVKGHHYGVETFNKKSGSTIGKGMNPDKLKEGLIKVKNYFSERDIYRGQISLICGLPYETKETWEDGVQWIHKNWAGQHMNFNVLEIPIDPKDSKLSIISKNYKKYGYRPAHKNVKVDLSNYYSNKFSQSLLDWENDIWTMTEAYNTCHENYERMKSVNMMGPWHWGVVNLKAKGNLKVLASYQKNEGCGDEIDYFITRYINKKLDWKQM
jgi:radical SAM superfamily enzyme YgiQ (UPF0313 family)